jgi:hypothetical protein
MQEQMSLLLRLHPLDIRQDENLTTAALVNLLGHLSRQRAEARIATLNRPDGETCTFDHGDIVQLEIETWASAPHGIPDFRIRTATRLLMVKAGNEIEPVQVAD